MTTLFLAVQIFDRYAYKKKVPPKVIQLTGYTSILIAEKFEEIYPTLMETYSYLSDRSFTK